MRYGALVDIGRGIIEKQVKRDTLSSVMRYALVKILPNPRLFNTLLKTAQILNPLLPRKLQEAVPISSRSDHTWPVTNHARKMLILDGCVQPALAPNINIATAEKKKGKTQNQA